MVEHGALSPSFDSRYGHSIEASGYPGCRKFSSLMRDPTSAKRPSSSTAGADATTARAPARGRLPMPGRGAAVTAVAIAVAALGGGWWWKSSSSAQSPVRIAVQPIEPLGSGAALASFANGLTDQITT